MEAALKEVTSAVRRCEKILPKFAEGTSQHSLLKNRIKALRIAEFLIERKLYEKPDSMNEREAAFRGFMQTITSNPICEELEKTLAPIRSIQYKCQAGQKKHEVSTRIYQQLQKQIDAMILAEDLILNECSDMKSTPSVKEEHRME